MVKGPNGLDAGVAMGHACWPLTTRWGCPVGYAPAQLQVSQAFPTAIGGSLRGI